MELAGPAKNFRLEPVLINSYLFLHSIYLYKFHSDQLIRYCSVGKISRNRDMGRRTCQEMNKRVLLYCILCLPAPKSKTSKNP